MRLLFTTLKKVLFWSYDRGTWQYDIMCVLILAFVFFAPNNAFQNLKPASAAQPITSEVFVSSEELGTGTANVGQIAGHLSERYGHPVTVSRIEPLMDETGKLRGYLTQISADRAAARD